VTLDECNDTDIRLVGGTNDTEGRIEVCLYGRWGTVCDDLWSRQDAIVACRQLGYPTGAVRAYGQAFFGQGTGPINIDNVNCVGNESLLLDCSYITDHNCVHAEDSGVVCGEAECDEGDVRLMDGSVPSEGRVEVCYNGLWGTVCDDFWSQTDAAVVCNQLNYSSFGALAYSQAFFGQGSGPINFDDVQCLGPEDNLLQCNFNPQHNCLHSEDAGVRCVEVSPSVSPSVAPLGVSVIGVICSL
jgi:deleted-in-malignant-brain-tumors protein 1